MEISKTEMELAQTAVIEAHAEAVAELSALDLMLIGGGTGLDIFG